MNNVINVKNLSFSYLTDNSKFILEELSISFESGKISIIIGPNGVGKTTFLKCLTGVYSDYDGEILMDAKISFVLDTPLLQESLKVNEYVEYVKKIADDKFITNFDKLLLILNLDQCNEEMIRDLSAGQKHKLAYAVALSYDSDIYVLDEPLLFLDIKSQIALKEMIINLNKLGKTFIISTHIISNAYELGKNVYIMKDSKINKLNTQYQTFEEFNEIIIKEV
jgi:ABC-2 type transport system ATP-binding protein